MNADALADLVRGYHVGRRDLVDVLQEAYDLGRLSGVQDQEPEVYRLATKDGELISRPPWASSVKRFYETVTGARRARQFGPKGCKVQAGRVQWEDV